MSGDSKQYRIPSQVLVYCFRRKAGGIEYLMLRRTAEYGGFWQGVTGAPEGEESLLEGAARELREETRLSPNELFLVDFSYSFPVEDRWKWVYHPDVKQIDEYVFLAEIAAAADPVLSFEHDSYQWAKFDLAMALLKWPNNREALEFCDRLLKADY
jgi:8-oxo-dGTP pyrophosphatase MutT (NUDIX family)